MPARPGIARTRHFFPFHQAAKLWLAFFASV